MSDVRWEPVEDGTFVKCNHPGTDCDDFVSVHMTGPSEFAIESSSEECDQVFVWLPPDVRLCRAVPSTWSQERPTVAIGEAAGYWVWRKGWGKMVSYARLRHSRFPGGTPALWLYYDDGLRTPLDEMPPDTWYMPATVPQPPTGEVRP